MPKPPTAEETVHDARSALPLHRHRAGYIAVVMHGRYDEASPDGRFTCNVGTVVAHPRFHTHVNRFSSQGARVLNLPLPAAFEPSLTYRVAETPDVGAIVRLARVDPLRAARAALEELTREAVRPAPPAWILKLAAVLRSDAADGRHQRVQDIAASAGISAAHASRAFRDWYGVPPVRYRREHRVRRALFLLEQGWSPAHVAATVGFSDQAHLTREVKKVTGATPARLIRASLGTGRRP